MEFSEVFLERKTRETKIQIKILFPFAEEKIKISTGIGFFDHMLEILSYHSGLALEISAQGDLHVDFHHTVEDVGILLGEALDKFLGKREGISRYGDAIIPLEEALTLCAIDLAKRPYLSFEVKFPSEKIGNFDTELFEEFFRALVNHGKFTLHLKNLSGKNSHHIAETLFKAFAHALKKAISPLSPVFSTKGVL